VWLFMHVLSGEDYYDSVRTKHGGAKMATMEEVGISEEEVQEVEKKLSKVPGNVQEIVGAVESCECPHPCKQQHCFGD